MNDRKVFTMKVTNINGTAGGPCACGSWLEHWKNFSRQNLLAFCPEERCVAKPELGTLVQKDDSTDTNWYVIPLCKRHHGMKGKSIAVGDYISLVPADVDQTCGKKVI